MIEVYGFDSALHRCAACEALKELFSERGLDYTLYPVMIPAENDLGFDYNRPVLDGLYARLGYKITRFPQVFIDGVHIGGYFDVRNYYGNLDRCGSSSIRNDRNS